MTGAPRHFGTGRPSSSAAIAWDSAPRRSLGEQYADRLRRAVAALDEPTAIEHGSADAREMWLRLAYSRATFGAWGSLPDDHEEIRRAVLPPELARRLADARR